jgi:hypothetical protein
VGGRKSEPSLDSNHVAIGMMGAGRCGSDRKPRSNRTPTGTATAPCRSGPTLSLAQAATGTAGAVCLIVLCLIVLCRIALCVIALCRIAPCVIAPCVTGLILIWDRTPTETMGGARPWTDTGSGPSAAAGTPGQRAVI